MSLYNELLDVLTPYYMIRCRVCDWIRFHKSKERYSDVKLDRLTAYNLIEPIGSGIPSTSVCMFCAMLHYYSYLYLEGLTGAAYIFTNLVSIAQGEQKDIIWSRLSSPKGTQITGSLADFATLL